MCSPKWIREDELPQLERQLNDWAVSLSFRRKLTTARHITAIDPAEVFDDYVHNEYMHLFADAMSQIAPFLLNGNTRATKFSSPFKIFYLQQA